MKALLVIDMLQDFIAEDGVLTTGKAGREIIGFIQEKIQEFREQGYPVIFICDHHEADDKEFDMFRPTVSRAALAARSSLSWK